MPTLEITTIVGCKNMCDYCPQDKLLAAYNGNRRMSFLDFKRLLNNVPKNVRIDFTGFSEAFLNNEASLMMRYSIKAGYYVVLYTTLVGFTSNDADILSDVNFYEVVFHMFNSKNFNLEKFQKQKDIFECHVQKHSRMAVIDSPHESAQTNSRKWSRAGNLWDVPDAEGKFRCAFADKLFDHNVVLPNGDVYLCCQDYSLKHKIGNLFETNFNDLDRQKIIDLSNIDKSDIICRKCELFIKD